MTNTDVMNIIGMSAVKLSKKFDIFIQKDDSVLMKGEKYPHLIEAMKEVLSHKEYEAYGFDEFSDYYDKLTESSSLYKYAALPTTTALEVPGKKIADIIDVVGAEVVYGHNMFKGIASEVRDLVGGRSVSIQKTLAESRKEALLELKEAAGELGADAVIAVSFTYTNINSSGISPLVAATGTAVKLAS